MSDSETCQYVVVERLIRGDVRAYGPYNSRGAAEEAKEKMIFGRGTDALDVAPLYATQGEGWT